MLSVRPKVAELTFQLYGRSLHPELFDVHRTRTIERTSYQAHVQITSAGHVVTWHDHGLFASEVCAAANHPLPVKRRLFRDRLTGDHSKQVRLRTGTSYETSYQLETVAPQVFWNYQEEFLLNGQQESLLHNFDSSGRIAMGALSYINIESRSHQLKVQVFHTFPDDCAIVKSQSIFTLP